MAAQSQDPWLLTPGPLTTSLKTKKAIQVDESDQLLRVDIEISGDNEIFRFTKFIEFGLLKKLE